jgi:hypothetical protein
LISLLLLGSFRDCGFTEEQMVQTLRYMCTEAPITMQCNIVSLKMFLTTGMLPRDGIIHSSFGPVTCSAQVHRMLFDASNYGGDTDDLPVRATCIPVRSVPGQDFSIPANQVLITLRGVHGRSTLIHKLPWPTIGPEAVRYAIRCVMKYATVKGMCLICYFDAL